MLQRVTSRSSTGGSDAAISTRGFGVATSDSGGWHGWPHRRL